MTKWPEVIQEGMWPFASHHMICFHNASVCQHNRASPYSLFTECMYCRNICMMGIPAENGKQEVGKVFMLGHPCDMQVVSLWCTIIPPPTYPQNSIRSLMRVSLLLGSWLQTYKINSWQNYMISLHGSILLSKVTIQAAQQVIISHLSGLPHCRYTTCRL